MTKKNVNVRVTTLEAELRFAIESDTVGQQLFEQVVKNIGIQETWFFGLQYTDSKNVECWLKSEKKVLDHDFPKGAMDPLTFKFRVRFYPEEVSVELNQDVTQKFFYLQLKEAILSGDLYCPSETCVLLASYAMQVKFGDFEKDQYQPGSILNQRVLPRRVVEQYRLSPEQWEQSVINWWQEHHDMMREDARLEYLKVVQDLEIYGVTYFEIQNKKKTELFLGVDALGLNIYDRRDKIIPKIGFQWNEIGNISYDRKKFILKPSDKKSPNVIFFTERRRINRQILALCRGNHDLYIGRRRPLPPEVLAMKSQAKRERDMRRQHHERSLAEKEREDRERKDIEERTKALSRATEAVEKDDSSRRSSQSSGTESIEEQTRLVRQADEQQQRLSDAERRLTEERERSQQLQEKMITDLKHVQDERNQIFNPVRSENASSNGHRNSNDSDPSEYDEPIADIRSSDHQEKDDENDEHDDDDSLRHDQRQVELQMIQYPMRPEPDRLPVAKRNASIGAKLKETRRALEPERLQEDTPEDKIYRENVIDKGIDKYKTLKKIREGTVKRRIDEFEAM